MDKSGWLQHIDNIHKLRIDYTLEPVKELYSKLKFSKNKIAKTIITVAGTNGKGSTVELLEKIYLAAGYKTGSCISPHLVDFNERIRINNQKISDQELISAFEVVEKHRKDQIISSFCFTTMAALHIFSQHDLDVVILEVGMGGRLDAVNVVDNDLAIITSIGLDHMEFLGDTIEKIAFEKAGIIRENGIVISGVRVKEAQEVISNIAQEKHAKIYDINNIYENFELDNISKLIHPDNAAIAYKTIEVLQDILPINNYKNNQKILDIFKNFKLQGRKQELVIKNKIIILDVAHNLQAVEYVINYLKENKINDIFVVFGGLNTKDTNGILKLISDNINVLKYFLVKVDAEKAMDFQQFNSVLEGLDAAILEATQDNIILVLGSFHTVKPVIEKYVK